MYKRDLADFIEKNAGKYPVVTITGPRQSGKSTLCRMVFPKHSLVSLEEPDIRNMAQADPRGFFKQYPGNIVLDEIQRVPDLFSYVQTIVDDPSNKRHFVLTGSHNLVLMEKVTQSLAGRTIIVKLLPFSRNELWKKHSGMTIDEFMITGGYPRIYDKKLEPGQWLQQYYQTYVERDIRSLSQINNLDQFERFISLCAGRAGQLLNLESLGNDCGVSQPTARSWLSILKAGFICFTLQPHHKNFNKRIIKSPKIYFYDTGLLCYLLKIKSAGDLALHPLRGAIFENWIICEHLKYYYNRGIEPPLYFWRDAKGHEIDLVIDEGSSLFPIEIKSSYTFDESFLRDLKYFSDLQGKKKNGEGPSGECCYCGDKSMTMNDFAITSWSKLPLDL